MVNINRNSALETLQGLVEQSFNKNLTYMSDEFNEQQQIALNLFKQRIFLEEVIEQSISFNKKLNWQNTDTHIGLVCSAEELVEVYKLRSDIYAEIGFNKECPDPIDGLNFDNFDKNSAIVFYKNNKKITGTCRLIFDSEKKLLTENKTSFDEYRQRYGLICELSRLVISNENKGLGLEYKKLTAAIYNIYKYNKVGLILSGMKKDHYKWYKKFGGFNIEKELDDGYGKVEIPFVITSWDPSKVSPFFKRAFLNEK